MKSGESEKRTKWTVRVGTKNEADMYDLFSMAIEMHSKKEQNNKYSKTRDKD